jgi:FtsH-binding integral membrane protein
MTVGFAGKAYKWMAIGTGSSIVLVVVALGAVLGAVGHVSSSGGSGPSPGLILLAVFVFWVVAFGRALRLSIALAKADDHRHRGRVLLWYAALGSAVLFCIVFADAEIGTFLVVFAIGMLAVTAMPFVWWMRARFGQTRSA